MDATRNETDAAATATVAVTDPGPEESFDLGDMTKDSRSGFTY